MGVNKLISTSKHISVLALVFYLLLTCGCVQVKPDTFPSTSETTELYVPICAIHKHSAEYLGKTIRINAKYESDNATYSYLEGNDAKESCKGKNIIKIASASLMKGKSVRNFFAVGDHGCEKRNMSLCIVSADVDFYAQVRKGDGSVYLWMTRVVAFKYHW